MVTPLHLLDPRAHGPRELALERWRVCRECPNLRAGHVCSKCGCAMKLKVRLEDATCPDGRWER